MKTLTEKVTEFLYTHMPQTPNRKDLVRMIQAGEREYVNKILELERKLAQKEGAEKQDSESPPPFTRNWHNFD